MDLEEGVHHPLDLLAIVVHHVKECLAEGIPNIKVPRINTLGTQRRLHLMEVLHNIIQHLLRQYLSSKMNEIVSKVNSA